MRGQALVLKSDLGWSIAAADGIEATSEGLGMSIPAPPISDEEGMFSGLDLPTGVAVDAVGRVYVSDLRNHAIKRYDPSCPEDRRVETLPCLGGDGSDVRNLREPCGLAIRGDNLFIVDAGNARVLAVSLSRMVLRRVVGPIDDSGRPFPVGSAAAWKPWDVAIDDKGYTYVSDRRGRLFRFSSHGRLVGTPVMLAGSGEGPIHLALVCPPRLFTKARPIVGEIELAQMPAAGSTEAEVDQDARFFIESGDIVEFRSPRRAAERRVVAIRDQPEPVIVWTAPLQSDYRVPGSFVRMLSAARAGERTPAIRVESTAGWSSGEWLWIEGPMLEAARVIDVRDGTLVIERSSAEHALVGGRRLTRATPLLAVADARSGEGKVHILDAEGHVLKADAARSDLLVFARYGGLVFGADLLDEPSPHPVSCDCAQCGPGRRAPVDLEAALWATLKKRIVRRPAPVYSGRGSAIIGPLDSRLYHCQWDRILAEVTVPETTRLTLETLTSEISLDPKEAEVRESEWRQARLDGEFPNARRSADRELWDATARDALVQSTPARYLYLRIRMFGDGSATPSVRELRIAFPRHSYLDRLPAIYSQDQEGSQFLERFLSIFQTTLDGFNREIDAFGRLLDPRGTPKEFIPWLASWLALALDWPWPEHEREGRQRALLEQAPDLYRIRGTPDGLRKTITAYTGLPEDAVHLVEAFCARNWMHLTRDGGRGGFLAGTCLFGRMQLDGPGALGDVPLDVSGDPALDPFTTYAHRFTVVVPAAYASGPPFEGALSALVDRERPAHTQATIYAVEPKFRVGIQSVVGVDTLIGTYPLTEVGKGRLGIDTLLTCLEPTEAEVGRTTRIGESLAVS